MMMMVLLAGEDEDVSVPTVLSRILWPDYYHLK